MKDQPDDGKQQRPENVFSGLFFHMFMELNHVVRHVELLALFQKNWAKTNDKPSKTGGSPFPSRLQNIPDPTLFIPVPGPFPYPALFLSVRSRKTPPSLRNVYTYLPRTSLFLHLITTPDINPAANNDSGKVPGSGTTAVTPMASLNVVPMLNSSTLKRAPPSDILLKVVGSTVAVLVTRLAKL